MSAETAQIIIGVDGGGSGCRVAVGTVKDGILAQAKGKSANVSTDFKGAIAHIKATVHDATQSAGLPLDALDHAVAHLGLAGADLPSVRQHTANALPYGRICISGDRQTTVAGVLGPKDGFVVALGTGTIIARQRAGVIKTVSGWGFQLSDRASGAWLGRSLLSDVLDAEEGLIPSSPLSRSIAKDLGGVHGIFSFSTTATPGDYATFAPQVFAAAAQQDAIALALLHAGTAYIEKGLAALDWTDGSILSLAGGVGPHYAPYLDKRFTDNLGQTQGTALQGAFSLACAAAPAPVQPAP